MLITAHIVFTATLLLNTVFSVRFWRPLQPKHASQLLIDGILLLIYLSLAFSIGHSTDFAFFATLLFIVAAMKYALMLEHIPHSKTIRKKILIDLLGAVFCAIVLLATLMGYELQAAFILAFIFALANVYLLWHKPMYQLL